MGLDAVEIIMEVEEAFDIEIPDEIGQKIETVGQLYEYVVEQTRDRKDRPADDVPARIDVCLSAAVFYLLRRELCIKFGLDRGQVRPRVPLEELLPRTGRRRRWSELAHGVHLKLPRLVRPRWVVATATALSLAVTFAATWRVDWPLAYLPGLVVLIATCALASCLTVPLANRFAPQMVTIGDLCNTVVAHNYRMLVAQFSSPSASDVFQLIKTILVEQLNVHPARITKDASLVKDLGMD